MPVSPTTPITWTSNGDIWQVDLDVPQEVTNTPTSSSTSTSTATNTSTSTSTSTTTLSPTPSPTGGTATPTPTLTPTTMPVEVPNNARTGVRVDLPVIDNTTCETWVTIQNVGAYFSKAVMVTWGNPGPCQPQALGPNKVECTGLLKPGSAWTFTKDQLPSGAKSGIVYSFDATTDSNANGVADAGV